MTPLHDDDRRLLWRVLQERKAWGGVSGFLSAEERTRLIALERLLLQDAVSAPDDPPPLTDEQLARALALNARCCGYSALRALKPAEGHLVLRCWKCHKTVVEYIGGRFLIRP